MNHKWETRNLGEICNIIGGGTPSKANSKYYNGEIPWATIRDMNGDYIVETEHKITQEAVKNSSTNIIARDNVIIATRVGLGKVCLIKNDTAINQDLRGVIPKNSNELSAGYLFQWLKSIAHLIKKEGTGATVQGVKLPFIKSLSIPLPPFSEQKRIVSILDKAFAAITKAKENAEKNLQNARELFESYLQSVFANPGDGWEEKRLGEVCDLQNGFAFKSENYVEKSSVMNFRMSQIKIGGGIDLDNNPKYLPESYAEIYKDYLLKDGDIVIAMTDMATETKILGVPTIVITDGRKLLLNQRVGKLFGISPHVFVPYLRFVLTSPQINNYYKTLGRGGLQINIGKQDILKATIPLPSLPKQKRIVAKLDALSSETKKLEAIYQQKLADLEELKKSVLQKAFNGEL